MGWVAVHGPLPVCCRSRFGGWGHAIALLCEPMCPMGSVVAYAPRLCAATRLGAGLGEAQQRHRDAVWRTGAAAGELPRWGDRGGTARRLGPEEPAAWRR
ncbi:hypothetical protein Aca07nite_42330 [Actinoplanes capillaceus]|uniref:Uncharacterized protein n=1 Tax=Actinoplanes campanulatus TaxID=113559 RepID=A0ABQ3WL33_9ACTN|nr:hypothetical protein Aca07nite_42330 [Actinoplanes capillaceus]